MPVARGLNLTSRQTLLVAAAAIFVVLGFGALVVFVVTKGDDVKVNIGDDVFQRVNATTSAKRIRQSGPVIYSDVSSGTRDIYLQHIGNDDQANWFAFDARPAGQPRDCYVQWDAGTREFVANDRCANAGTRYPQTGEGLGQYATRVDGNRVIVDLKAAPGASPTTAAPGTSTPIVGGAPRTTAPSTTSTPK
jgi:hypothetical protein